MLVQMLVFKLWTILELSAVSNNWSYTIYIVAVYNVDENLTPVLLSAMHTCFMSHFLVLVLLQLVLTTTMYIVYNMTVYKCLHSLAPKYLAELCVPVADVAGRRQLRSASRGLLNFPRYMSKWSTRSVSPVLTSGTHFLSISGNQHQ